MTITAAAAALGVSSRTILRLMTDRPDLGRKIGRHWRIDPGILSTLKAAR